MNNIPRVKISSLKLANLFSISKGIFKVKNIDAVPLTCEPSSVYSIISTHMCIVSSEATWQ